MSSIDLIATIETTSRSVETVTELLADYAAEVTAEPGNQRFEVYATGDDATRIVVIERYVDRAAFDAHLQDPRNAAFNAALADALGGDAGSALTMLTRLV